MIDINDYPERLEKLVRVSNLNPSKEDFNKLLERFLKEPEALVDEVYAALPKGDADRLKVLSEAGRMDEAIAIVKADLERKQAIKEQDTKSEQLLRKISAQVDVNKPAEVEKAQALIKELEEILIISQHSDGRPEDVLGLGLSAIQVREFAEKEWVPRVTVIRVPYNKGKPLILNMINPQVIRGLHSYTHKNEGCLSYPGIYLSTKRFYGIRLGFVDAADLKPREMDLYGIEAVCVQHEVDHHDGILFKDKHNFPMEVKAKVGPNEKCTCGSGKKFKKCCGSK